MGAGGDWCRVKDGGAWTAPRERKRVGSDRLVEVETGGCRMRDGWMKRST